jgi:hypothetical protein
MQEWIFVASYRPDRDKLVASGRGLEGAWDEEARRDHPIS